VEYYKQIEELRSMQQVANEKLGQWKEAGDDPWEDLRAGMDSAWDSLNSATSSLPALVSVDTLVVRFRTPSHSIKIAQFP